MEGPAQRYACSSNWIAERIEAARLCPKKKVRIEPSRLFDLERIPPVGVSPAFIVASAGDT
jgi:hypothetical protein